MKKILTIAFLLLLFTAGAQTSVSVVHCGQRTYYLRVSFEDSIAAVHDVSTTICADYSVHADTEEGQFLSCRMELFSDPTCTVPVAVDARFFAFARDVNGSAGTRDNPAVIYDNSCAATVPGGSAHDYNYRIDYSMIWLQQCIWQCSGSGYYNCYPIQNGEPVNYNIVICCCYAPSVLAVHLLDFGGLRNGGQNTINWKLENTIDFSKVELERSFDGVSFGVVYVTGDPSTAEYTDGIDRTAYYRLRVYNKNGSSFYSSVLALKIVPGYSLSVYPSPFKDVVNVSVSSPADMRVTFKVISPDGRLVYGSVQDLRAGMNKLKLAVSDICTGTYVLLMNSILGTDSRKIMRQ